MKRLYLLVIALLSLQFISAQQGINYKALIKDGSGNVVANDLIAIQFTILEGAGMTNVYQETHTPNTDANGIVIVNIGQGTTSDDFIAIDWGSDDHYLNVQINTGSGLTDMSTTQFMAVPYALNAANAASKIDDLSDGKSDNDGTDNGSSVFLGIDAGLNDDGTDNENVAVGFEALYSNTEGFRNTANGHKALYNNIGGRENTATGERALYSNTEGYWNTAIGFQSLFFNSTGIGNTANGFQALNRGNVGLHNTAIGAQALFFNEGSYNTVNGFKALRSNITGNANTVNGYFAGYNNLGNGNVFMGHYSGYTEVGSNTLYIENVDANADNALIYGEFGTDNTTTDNILRTNSEFQIGNPSTTGFAFPLVDGTADQVLQTDGNGSLSWTATVKSINNLTDGRSDADGSSLFIGKDAGLNDDGTANFNVAVGFEALKANTIGVGNTAIGDKALLNNIEGNSNTANGRQALRFNTTGSDNVANGSFTLYNNNIGNKNTATGYSALSLNNIGNENVATGYNALDSNFSGNSNSATGSYALYSNSTGSENTANGHRALNNNNGIRNTATGFEALYSNTTGNYNTAMGYKALHNKGTGDWNTAYGRQALSNLTSGTNNIGIGYNAQSSTTTASNQVTLGNKANNVYRMYAASWTNASDRQLKHAIKNIPVGLDFVLKLHPVEFVYNNANNEQITFGFIAQDIKQAVEDFNLEDNILVSPLNKQYLGLRTTELISVLTKAIQEQQEIIEKQNTKIETILKRVEQLEATSNQ